MALKLIQGKQLNVNLTGSFTGSFSGSFNGTGSYATQALSASYALSSSYSTNISGSTNYVPKFSGSNSLGNSLLYDDGTNVGIGTTSPGAKLDVAGDVLINGLTIGRGGGNISTNTANGYRALFSNTSGSNNTANGSYTLYNNLTGGANVALGYAALYTNTTGNNNTAVGLYSLFYNTTGNQNTSVGRNSMLSNTSGYFNTSVGLTAMLSNTTGHNNTGFGRDAILSNIEGIGNTAIGSVSGRFISGGDVNVVDPTKELSIVNYGVFLGSYTKALQNNSINEIVIGANTVGNGSNTVTLGNTDIITTVLRGNVGIGTTTPTLGTLQVNGNVYATSFTGSFSGSFDGTGSYALQALSASYALSSSYSTNISGTTNYVSKFTGDNTLGNSLIYDNGTSVGIGTTAPGAKLDVAGDALFNNITIGKGGGNVTYNTAVGRATLYNNTTGSFNSALGYGALYSNTLGNTNTGIGAYSLFNNTIGNQNTSIGMGSMQSNTTGYFNTSVGLTALYRNTSGSYNSGFGAGALYYNITGSNNISIGAGSGAFIIGGDVYSDPSMQLSILNNCIFIGVDSKGFTNNSDNEIVIGYAAGGAGSNTVTLGNTNIITTILRGDIGIGKTAPNAKLDVSGSAIISGSLAVTNGITGSLFGTSSWATNATNAGTASNILGGVATHIPFFDTDTTLATSSLYQSGSGTVIINQDNATTANPEALYVWQPSTTSFNVISGKGNLNNYLQLNIHNTNQGTAASSDVVATANNGDETTNYIDMGINSENFSGAIGGPNDAYLYSAGQHLHIGNTTPNKPIQFFVGGPDSNADRKFELNANGQHNMTGSLEISGSLKVNQGITGSLFGTASYAVQALSASWAPAPASTFPYTGSALITGSLEVIGSLVNGIDNVASGSYSHAEGNQTIASGDYSHAEGQYTLASGSYSHAEGNSTKAQGQSSHAEGDATIASGQSSHAEGESTTSIGIGSHAEGYYTTALGAYSHAEGYFTTASGDSSHAEGETTSASGKYSHAEGGSTISSGDYSHAEGQDTLASGDYSHAEGANTLASGQGSHAEGLSTIASGIYSHAEGVGTLASGDYSHAEGVGASASGIGSHAEGQNTQAIGNYSHAEGLGTIALGRRQHVQGMFNISSSQDGAFILGNGSADNTRSNLIFAAGNSVQITGSLNVSGSITGSILGTASYAENAATASYAPSYLPLTGGTINGNVTINGTASITFLNVQYESASVIYSSGSNIFGDATNDTQTLNGTVLVSGSQQITGSLNVSQGITGSLFGTSSWAVSASWAPTQYIDTGSLVTTSSFNSFTSSYNTGSFKGTLAGTASWALNASTADSAINSTSASHAIQADSALAADYAAIAGNGGVTSLIAGSGVTLIPSTGMGNVTIVTTGGGGTTIISGSNITSSFINSNTWVFNHELGIRTPTITVFDSNYNQIIPQNIELVSTASATITFPTLESGFAVAMVGGVAGNAYSASYSLYSTYAATASYFVETDPIFVAKSGSLATTGSNRFIGNQTITGSVYISSGSSLNLNGNTLYSSASTLFTNANIVPTQHNTQSLGTTTERWKDIWLGGGSIYIADTVIPNSDLIVESINNIFTISGSAGLEVGSFKFINNELFLKNEAIPIIIGSGSSTAPVELKRPLQIVSGETGNITFNATREGRVQIISPNIPANDIGAFSIIGNTSGSYQPVINPSGMVHVTGNDAQAARITVDGFGTNIGTIYVGRHARGTAALPTPTLSGDVLVRFAGLGYATSSYFPVVGAVPTSLEFQATENYSTSSYGSRAAFYTYANGAVSRSLSAIIDATGITIPSSSLLFGTASWALNALTASYVTSSNIVGTVLSSSYALTASHALNVQIINTGSFATTGSNTFTGNQIVSGSLTLNSGSAFNLNDGFFVNGHKQFQYASFYHTASQTLTSATTPLPFQFSTIENNSGAFTVALSGSRRSRITTNTTGWWNIQYSAQVTNGSSFNNYDSYTWIRVNEVNTTNSNNIRTIPQDAFDLLASRNTLIYLESGSYFEIMYGAASTQVSFPYTGTGTSPTRPATPSISLVVTQHA